MHRGALLELKLARQSFHVQHRCMAVATKDHISREQALHNIKRDHLRAARTKELREYTEDNIKKQLREQWEHVEAKEGRAGRPALALLPYFKSLNHCRCPEDTWELLLDIRRKQVPLHLAFFNKMLNRAAKYRSRSMAEDLFIEIRRSGFEPDDISWNTALKLAHRLRDFEYAVEIWRRMARERVTPCLISYNTMLACLGDPPEQDRLEAFPELRLKFASMLRDKMQSDGLEPDVVTYSSLLNIYAKAGLCDTVEALEQEMYMKAVEVNDICINTIMTAFNLAQRYEQTIKYFTKYSSERSIRNNPIWATLMNAYCELQRIAEVKACWEQLHSLDLKPDVVTWGILIKALARENHVVEIEEALRNGENRGLKADVGLWNTLIHELYKLGNIEEAINFFKRGYFAGDLKVWNNERPNVLDLHTQTTSVGCCAVRYFLSTHNDVPLEVFVGRGISSSSNVQKNMGQEIRELLMSERHAFTEHYSGGMLIIEPSRDSI